MNKEEYEKYFKILNGENWKTIGLWKLMRITNPFVRHVNGGACFTDFDYNFEDGKTYYCENDSFNQKIEKKNETTKY